MWSGVKVSLAEMSRSYAHTPTISLYVICQVSCVICLCHKIYVKVMSRASYVTHLFKVCVICPMSRWFMSRHHVSCVMWGHKIWSCVMSCVICHLSCVMLCGQSWFCIHLEESKRFFRTFILGDKRLRLFRARASGSRSV
jgi:hypothetical protein